MAIPTDENGAVLISTDESGTPQPIGKIRGALNVATAAGYKMSAAMASAKEAVVTFSSKVAQAPRIRNTSARSMRRFLNSRCLTFYSGRNKRVIVGKRSVSVTMPINLGRNARKRQLRANLPRKQWPTLAPHRESK